MTIRIKTFQKTIICAAFLSIGLINMPNAHAQDTYIETTAPVIVDADAPVDILPAARAEENGYSYDEGGHTHPAIELTPDKSELVRLDKAAGSIIIGNPNHLSVLADSSQTLVLVPRAPGATHFTVLGKNGAVLMQRHVIVGSPKEKYLRVRRSCAGTGDDSCQNTSVFYCPDMCHEIMIDTGDSTTASAGDAANGTGGENGGNGGGNGNNTPQNVPEPQAQ